MNHKEEFVHQDETDCDKLFSRDVIVYQEQVESTLAWLFSKEEALQSRPDEAMLQNVSYNHILEEYKVHEKFMTEFCEFCHVIMRCKQEGQDLRDGRDDLTDEDRDEVGIQMDALMVCYEKLKILTTDRLQSLQRIIEVRQQSKIEQLEEWLSAIEKKIINSTNIGPDYTAIQKQVRDLNELKKELEQKQDLLNFISKIIIFDEIDPESLQFRPRSSESIDNRLETMNERWTKICRYVDERNVKLQSAESIWKLLSIEGPQLAAWLTKVDRSLNEVSEAARNVIDPVAEKPFVTKLMNRSDKIDLEIKNKQSFYTGLENEVRLEIEKLEIDDSCAMLVIGLERKLEEMQDNWNSIMNRKRMLDFTLQALMNPKISDNVSCSMIPIPDPITSNSRTDLRFEGPNRPTTQTELSYNDQMNNSSSSNNDDREIIHANGMNGSLSDARAFDNSLSSDTKSIAYGNNQRQTSYTEDFDSRDEISSPSITASYPSNMISKDDSSYSILAQQQPNDILSSSAIPQSQSDSFSEHTHDHNNGSCRVEEWKHSLESFSTWLRQVEISLAIEESLETIEDHKNVQRTKSWSKMDLAQQISLLADIENRINTSCQDEFDCLLLQGQQIIEDLIPEIGENDYEANLKEILTDIEIRYSTVKRFLNVRRQELTSQDRWRELLRKIRDSCDYLIHQMSEVIPESNIGVDLITLAQQQDQLIHAKADLADNAIIQANIQEAKLFLRLCDSLQQQYIQYESSQSTNNAGRLSNEDYPTRSINIDMWLSFRDLREDIEGQLDRMTLHYSELSQLIDDRLARLDEVHKEMHAIQHKMQELATKLQVAEILKSNWTSLENLDVEKLSEQLEDLKLYRERLGEVQSVHKILNSVFQWMTQSGVPLSQQNLKRIDELNSIWDSIQESVDDRQKQIEQAFDNQTASEQKFLNETVADLPKWERRVAPTKIPYFVNHETNKTIWDHPRFTDILNDLTSVKNYQFSAYRTALKLKMVQRGLGIDLLMLEKLKEVFEATDFKIRQDIRLSNQTSNQKMSNSGNETLIGVEHLIIYLKAIYEKVRSEEKPSLNVPLSIDLTLNWLLNLYDSTRTGFISNLSLKVGLALICCATREEKYTFMYQLVSNHITGTVDSRKLGTLAEICMRIPIYLGEGESFGGAEIVESSVRDCFAMSKYNPAHPNCIDMTDFINWLKTEPQFIIWLTVLHRLLISERTVHPVGCKLCGTKPIVGLRYRCLKCLKFNICQHCFLTGRHILEHPDPAEHTMQEYCSKTSSGENVRDLTKILRNKIIPKSKSSGGSRQDS